MSYDMAWVSMSGFDYGSYIHGYIYAYWMNAQVLPMMVTS